MKKNISRREFLKIGGYLATGFGLSQYYTDVFASGLNNLVSGTPKIIWLQAQSCSGCSVSFLNANGPYIQQIITELVSIMFHPTISAAQGDVAIDIIKNVSSADFPFIFIVEGAIPLDMPKACMIGEETFEDMAIPLLKRAKYIMAAGTCATYGGIPSAEGNPTGAVGVMDFMKNKNIPYKGRLVNCPLCPTHPASIIGTLAYLAGKGYPDVDEKLLTPHMFYAHSVHYNCPRYHFYEKGIFADKFGDEGCLFKLGCLGPLSYTTCPWRQWNGGINWCIRAAAPCIGCSHPYFAKFKDFPFYRKGEKYHQVKYQEKDRTSK